MKTTTEANHWGLFLDVDGTLLDFAPAPNDVRVDDELRNVLRRAGRALDGAVALVTGRPIDQLDRLFAPDRWPAAGLHGLERRDASGSLHRAVLPDPALADVRRSLAAAVAAVPGAIFEDKGVSIALHYRLAPRFERQLRGAMDAAAARVGAGYQVLEGNRVLELKPAAATKADAIRAFMAEPPFAGRRPVFVGDDLTDLDGFEAVERMGGLSIAVGDRVSGLVRVSAPRDVRVLLAELAGTGVTA